MLTLLEAISKGPQLTIKIDGSSSCSEKVFWPNLFVGALFSPRCGMACLFYCFGRPQVSELSMYSCGLRPTGRIRSDGKSSYAGKLGSASILNQNPFFEMASIQNVSIFVQKRSLFNELHHNLRDIILLVRLSGILS